MSRGDLDYKFYFQQVCMVNILMSDFSILAGTTNSENRLSNVLSLMDKIANYKLEYRINILGENIAKRQAEEAECFKELFSEKEMKFHIKTIKYHLDNADDGLSKDIVGSVTRELDKLLNFSKHHELESVIRSLRNMRHGAFLSGEQFFKLYKQAEFRLPHGIVVMAYVYMLALIFDPKRFLEHKN